jgi:hypothetical protein
MIGDVNLPEHRGTMFGFGNFINGIGRGLGSLLVPVFAAAFITIVPEPYNTLWGIVVSMFSFIPMGLLTFAFFKTIEKDFNGVKEIMARRASELRVK